MERPLRSSSAIGCLMALVAVGMVSCHNEQGTRLPERTTTAKTRPAVEIDADAVGACRDLARQFTTESVSGHGSEERRLSTDDASKSESSGIQTAAPNSATAIFESAIRPIFVEHCYRCHGPDRQEGGLRLDRRESTIVIGPTGAAPIVAGNPSESRILQRVVAAADDLRMPLGGEPLSEQQVLTLSRWIADGANWPEESRHWAFVKPVRRALPAVVNSAWPENAIDVFVLAKLEQAGVRPAAEAHRETLIRRLSLDLIGLPPTPDDVDRFVADPAPDAYEALVDRLLASPRFGERWGIRWLDLARYADTSGFDYDDQRSLWPFRDWVIGALNRDLPFDQFTVEQLAGDLLPNPSERQLVATGFMRNSAWKRELEQSRFEMLVDRVNTLGTVWLGLSLGCAQCHNHKFDPISQKEYYQLYAYFNAMADDTAYDMYIGGELYAHSEFTRGAGGSTLVMRDRDEPLDTFVKVRGSFLVDGEKVNPGLPAALHPARCGEQNRLSLACWLIDEENPLTARVTVNRYWETIFGVGLVRTSEDFGLRAEPPSHAELLDWMAVEFRERGWSVKSLLRLIVTSATYRQESRAPAELFERDPQNRLLARGARFRLDAELVRDVALSAAGVLSAHLGGPSVFPPQPAGISEDLLFGSFRWIADQGEQAYRRGLYTYWKRNALYPGLALLDAPNRITLCARRTRSSTPVQALVTLNDPVYFDAAVHLGGRMLRDAGTTIDERAACGFRYCLGRAPTNVELTMLTNLFRAEMERMRMEPALAEARIGARPGRNENRALDPIEWAAWSIVANVLLNLDETITRE